jgi:phage shock protein A
MRTSESTNERQRKIRLTEIIAGLGAHLSDATIRLEEIRHRLYHLENWLGELEKQENTVLATQCQFEKRDSCRDITSYRNITRHLLGHPF